LFCQKFEYQVIVFNGREEVSSDTFHQEFSFVLTQASVIRFIGPSELSLNRYMEYNLKQELMKGGVKWALKDFSDKACIIGTYIQLFWIK